MLQLGTRAQDAGAISTQTVRLADQPKLDGVPVQARKQLTRAQAMRLQSARAVRLHVVGKYRAEQQRHMPKQVMKNVGLNDVVKLFG